MRGLVTIVVLLLVSAGWAADSWVPLNSQNPEEASQVTVRSMGTQEWLVQISVAGMSNRPVTQSGTVFDRLELPSETFADMDGIAALPAIARLIGL